MSHMTMIYDPGTGAATSDTLPGPSHLPTWDALGGGTWT